MAQAQAITHRNSGLIDDKRKGGWPFTCVLTVSATNPIADYTTIAAAITRASVLAARTIIVLDDETFTEAVILNVNNTSIVSFSPNSSIITQTANDTTAVTVSGDNCTLYNLRITNSGGGTTANCVKITGSDATVDRCVIIKTGTPTNANGIKIEGGTDHIIRDTNTSVSTGTNKYGILADTANSSTVVFGGNIGGATFSVRTNFAGATIRLLYPVLGTLAYQATLGAITGWYFDPNYNLIAAFTSGMSGGVWRETTGGLQIHEADLATAITNASAGDTIHLFPGTYSGAITVNKSISIIGSSPNEVILTHNDTTTVDITAASVTIANVTINNTDATGTVPVVTVNADGLTLDNVVINKTSGANSTSIGLSVLTGSTIGTLLRNSTIRVSQGSLLKWGVYLSTAACTLVIQGGQINGDTRDIYVDHASAIAEPRGARLLGGGIEVNAGTARGSYVNSTGQIFTSIENNVWHVVNFDLNYIITPSVATNDLTVALKTLSGNDPTAANRLSFKIGSTWRDVTAALTFTKNDGTNWMSLGSAILAAQDVDVFMYVMYETGASAGVKSFISRYGYGRVMSDFVNTTTSEKYPAGGWTNFNATDEVTCIGRFNVTLSATAAFNWSLPTQIVINRPIYETRWLTYVAAVTSTTGTITTVGTVTTLYQIVGQMLNYSHSVVITTNGTGATAVRISLPFTPVGNFVGAGNESVSTGKMTKGTLVTNFLSTQFYDGTYPAVNGSTLVGAGAVRLV